MCDTQENPQLRWVKLKRYCQLSGDTVHAVHARRRKGQWLDDIQCRLAPDGNLWINLIEVERWVEKSQLAALPIVRQA